MPLFTFSLLLAAATEPTVTTAIQPPPAVEVPSYVSEKKRMSEADRLKKREGMFVTGLPFFSSDPLNGVGGGATGYVHFNGRRTDPLFGYTPYTARLGLKGQYTTGSAGALALKLDMPFVSGTAWRLQVDAKYESSPNDLYFGLTEQSLQAFPEGRYSAYAKRLSTTRTGGAGEPSTVADALKHRFLEHEWMLNVKAERVLFDGNWRVLAGYEIQSLQYRTFDGTIVDAKDASTGQDVRVPNGASLLTQDVAQGRAFGMPGGRVSLLQLSLMYDTRDYEPDPSRGVFVELAQEHSSAYTGSAFTFHKFLLQGRFFAPLWTGTVARTVLATRVGYGTIIGPEATFFELQDQWSADGSIRALGGSQTLRGFKANRFLGRSVAFSNIELRHRFADISVLSQNLSFALVPFLDLGAIGDDVFGLKPVVKTSAGAGLRIGWNRSTMVLLDVAASSEDTQFFINFNNSY